MKRANVYLIPNTLGGESLSDIIPTDVSAIAISLRTFFVEELDILPLALPIFQGSHSQKILLEDFGLITLVR